MFVLDEVDFFNFGMDFLEIFAEVFAGFLKGSRVFSLPEEEQAVRKVINKNCGIICLPWRR